MSIFKRGFIRSAFYKRFISMFEYELVKLVNDRTPKQSDPGSCGKYVSIYIHALNKTITISDQPLSNLVDEINRPSYIPKFMFNRIMIALFVSISTITGADVDGDIIGLYISDTLGYSWNRYPYSH